MSMKFLQVPPKSATDLKWRTKEGKEIAICDMTEQHAKNALRMLLRKVQQDIPGLEGLEQFYGDIHQNFSK